MKVDGKDYRTIWVKRDDRNIIQIIDQRKLPHTFSIKNLRTSDDIAKAIKEMHVRGAGLIGAAAGYGMYLGCLEVIDNTEDNDIFNDSVREIGDKLIATRPTAVNLKWAVNRQLEAIVKGGDVQEKVYISYMMAEKIANEDADHCYKIGEHGLQIIKDIKDGKNGPVNILTHCNAGCLAFVDYGSATSPIYAAHDAGVPVHVWVSETRPLNQGASLTAWELGQHKVPYTVIVDNASGHLMQKGLVDMVITGADRVTNKGDVVNKIGTYIKAVVAEDNDIPFYVALPSSTFDWDIEYGKDVVIEERDESEVKCVTGKVDGRIKNVLVTPQSSKVSNYGFDNTPAELITGLITERGECEASSKGIYGMFPEKRK